MKKPHFRRKMRILKQSQSAEKCKRVDHLGFLKLSLLQTIKTIEKGTFSLVRF